MTQQSAAAHEFGKRAEELAAQYYQKQGYIVEAMNYRTRQGEIDVIARMGDRLVFAEVKARGQNTIAAPCEFVTPTKQRKIILAAKAYLAQTNDMDSFVRFDVVEVKEENGDTVLQCIQNAFTGE